MYTANTRSKYIYTLHTEDDVIYHKNIKTGIHTYNQLSSLHTPHYHPRQYRRRCLSRAGLEPRSVMCVIGAEIN